MSRGLPCLGAKRSIEPFLFPATSDLLVPALHPYDFYATFFVVDLKLVNTTLKEVAHLMNKK